MSMSDERPTTNQALLIRLESRLAVIESKIDSIADIEDRLRELEKARYQSAWIISVLSSVLTAGVVAMILRIFTT
jgi:hypothetical protein